METQADVVPCHPDHLPVVWPIISPWLERALKYGPDLYGVDDIRAMVQSTSMVLWLAIDANEIIGFSITSIVKYPRCTVADIHWTGGATHKGKFWMDEMLRVLKAWARHSGCQKLGGGGRRGWIEKYGFKEHGVMFEMELGDE
jgi:hypothetical protein